MENLNIMGSERVGISAIEPRNFLEHVIAQRRPVEALLLHLPAEHRRVFDVLGEMRPIDEQFLGHAAADHAGAADLVLFGDGDACTISGSDARRAYAAGTGPDHEQVKVGH